MQKVCFAKRTCGTSHSLVLLANGSVMASGRNAEGQLGDGTNLAKLKPIKVPNSSMATCVAAGNRHSVFMKNFDSARSWGWNGYGQLGVGSLVDKHAPTQITGMSSNVVDIEMGKAHTLVLKADGSVWTCGYNADGELGLGTFDTQNKPVKVAGLSNVIAIAAGEFSSYAMTADGLLWAWGYNGYGQLGTGDLTSYNWPTPVGWGFIQVAPGAAHVLALTVDGVVWQWGQSLTTSSIETNPVEMSPTTYANKIYSGYRHAALVHSSGQLYVWGQNGYGQLGTGDTFNYSSPFTTI